MFLSPPTTAPRPSIRLWRVRTRTHLSSYSRSNLLEAILEDDDEETLKVFVAPEFFWRGPNGAYDAATILKNDEYDVYEFNAISEICEELEHLVKVRNGLFVTL